MQIRKIWQKGIACTKAFSLQQHRMQILFFYVGELNANRILCCFVSFHLLSSVWYCWKSPKSVCGVKTPQVTSYRFGKITKEYANVLGKITHASPLLFGRVWHKMKRHERKKSPLCCQHQCCMRRRTYLCLASERGSCWAYTCST